MGRYEDVYRRSLTDPAGFWAEAARGVDWYTEPETILDDSNPPFYRWFRGGTLNTCHNALDRHADGGRGDQTALIYDSPVTGTKRAYTYNQLRAETARFAGVLKSLNIGKGDRVVIYMPMIPEAVVAMLACARLGAVHSVVFGGFAAHELAVRIDDARPKLIVSASCGIEVTRIVEYKPILDKAIDEAAHKPERTIIVQRPQATAEITARDLDWHELVAAAQTRTPAYRSKPPTRCTSSTPQAPQGNRKESSATTAATRSLSPGRCGTSTTRTPARCSGPRPTSAGSWATPTSCTPRCSPAAPRSCTRASPSALRTRVPSGASRRNTRSRPCSPRRPDSGRSARKTRTASWRRNTT